MDPNPHHAWLAAPFLHVLGAHPVLLQQYPALLGHPGEPRSRFEGVLGLARHMRNISSALARDRIPDLPRTDVILLGGLVDPSHLDNDSDFYFGTIPQRLADRGIGSLLVLRNQTGQPTRKLARSARREGIAARVLLPSTMSAKEEISFMATAIAGAEALGGFRNRGSGALGESVLRLAKRELRSPSTTGNLRLERQLESICAATGARAIVTMHEGHAWERCAWRGARRANEAIVCAGYQHTILRKHSHAIRRNVGRNADPELVLCVGNVTRSELEAEPRLEGTKFETMGTHRRKIPASRITSPATEGGCLVLPEGMLAEVVSLFRVALLAARAGPDIRFIFRLHPSFSFEHLVRHAPEFAALPENIEVSTGRDVESDFARSRWMLYRGSSTVLYGILAGVKPFYLQSPHELTIDPVYKLNTWRGVVGSSAELVKSFADDQATSQSKRLESWSVARKFSDDYVVSEQPAGITTLVEHIMANRRITMDQLNA